LTTLHRLTTLSQFHDETEVGIVGLRGRCRRLEAFCDWQLCTRDTQARSWQLLAPGPGSFGTIQPAPKQFTSGHRRSSGALALLMLPTSRGQQSKCHTLNSVLSRQQGSSGLVLPLRSPQSTTTC
ncbi:hypothetical protein WJX79_006676, partial [Trebouxia sp. C0005]